MTYKIRVIIPTYNSEQFIKTTIHSVQEQTIGFENIELILIDDFSTDNTPNIIKDYVEKYDNIKTYTLNKKAGAPGDARNIGIQKTQAEYLMFMDHDDKYPKTALETLYNKAQHQQDTIIIGRFKTFGITDWESDTWLTQETTINKIEENTQFLTINNIWRMIFPTKLIQENNIQFPEKMFAEDLAFMIESYFNAEKITFLPDITYCFRIRESDNSSTSYSKSPHYIGKLVDGYYYTSEIMKKYNKMQHYDLLFSMHLASWIDNIINSQIKPKDIYQLLKKAQPLFKDLNNIDLNINPNFELFRGIIEKLRDNQLDDAYQELLNIKNPTPVKEKGLKSKLKSLFK